MAITPPEWSPFSSEEKRLDYLKEHKLTPKTYKEPKPLFYSGIFAEGTEVCTAEGLVDENTLVIKVGESYHCIHPDYLLEMQSKKSGTSSVTKKAEKAEKTAPTVKKSEEIDFVAIDFETATSNFNSACSLGIAVVRNLKVTETWYHTFQPPYNYYEQGNVYIHGITPSMTLDEKPFDDYWDEIARFFDKKNLILAHNARFDTSVLRKSLKSDSKVPNFRYADTLNMVKGIVTGRHGLDACCEFFGIRLDNHHNGLADAVACAEIAIACVKSLGYDSFSEYKKKERLAVTDFHPQKNNLYARKAVKLSELTATVEQFDLTHPLYQKRIAFTGDLTLDRGAAMQLAVNKGAEVRSGVSAKTDILVIGRQGEAPNAPMNSKEKKARELTESGKANIRLMEEAEFMELVRGC